MYNFMKYLVNESDIWDIMVIELHIFIQGWWHDSQCNERARGAHIHDGLEFPSSCKREFIMILFQHCSNEPNIPKTKNILWGKCNKFWSTFWRNRVINFDGWIVLDFFHVGLKILIQAGRKVFTLKWGFWRS